MSDPPARPLRVLVVDDSATVRQALVAILGRAGMIVDVAADPLIAAHRLRADPDVLVLDVEMPRMDGLTFLRSLMATDPRPVVLCSGLATAGGDVALQALEDGAVAIVEKPRLGVRGFLEDSADRLVETVEAAARARVRSPAGRPPPSAPLARVAPARLARTTEQVVAIGASLGGTEALRVLLAALPPDAPGLAIVQHMPPAFTGPFARRLREATRLDVVEARDGDRLAPGRALVAPGDRHLAVRRSGAAYVVEILDSDRVSRHRPSVDVLFRSAAAAAGANAVGVLLTGMGSDGADGLLAMKRAGARTIAQDEQSSVVFGMAKEAIRRGAVDRVLPLSSIAAAILQDDGGRG